MQHVPLGTSGLTVSQLCLGTMQFGWTADEPQSFAVLDAFVAAGGNFIDTADVYSRWVRGNVGGDSERIIGRWMAARGNRDQLVVATKCRAQMWPGPEGEGLSRNHIVKACDFSLKRLGVDCIDLYQFHSFDENVPVEESIGAVSELVTAGKVRLLGVSNYPPERFEEIVTAGDEMGVPIVSLQPHHNLVHRKEFEDSLQDFCVKRGIGVIPYSPLAKGFLTGKYRKGGPKVQSARSNGVREYLTDAGWEALAAVTEIAAVHETTCAAVALAWQLAQSGITSPIVGANSPEQLADQLPATELTLTPEELAKLNAASATFA
ncbi:alcohol dehydrogenase [bacterium SCGC AG-212-C10]|nr:alcohol dehydrogenase [bacterium SCGC AG-212-C10]